ncbi:putative tyrosine recombinase XerC-like [Clostridium pasteurianum DSM 525 = ATCC 6013]|uniref:Integrase family protein n=1 Tax=Clostridium pasteurianum DSM 525 = ATCC 6013 TaxID=1262449 RepID=A0A0H3JAF0_CLOPA|nr:tyrosine-type recombinase/integrase [Clostridium pasteurianum]AJA48505.1 putative tyrosine recombinase XerC-like [Clostridium pasteurianum DSM 525 = ATCC 6013]AJA52493.1 putative tyrosine recombinase XerC-like [Clostridium pasteurianum DSM 525 = ATCC 6013]AOZ77356.1 recombinase XerC [Clostridium pasteurianum DSM 525 = ATCC 6013]AOZ81153.1 recombinase XerC [Clostridium pasteurianum]ELP60348.1 site-specific recombinase XerC [Clostridium pasteurianum DSM 525 = ATCC 6013]
MDYIKGFEDWLKERDKSNNTISCYLRDIKEFEGWLSIYSSDGLREVPQIFLIHFKKFQKGTEASITTINRKLASVNSFYKYMYQKGFINEELKVEQYKDKDAKQYKGLDERQLWKIRAEIHKAKNLFHICIFEILINTGIRVSELINIKLSDIQISDRKGSLTVIGKGEAKRTVPLNKAGRKAITDYLAVRRNDESRYLLIGQRGKLKRNAVNLILEKYGNRAGVKVTPHMARHTLGYNLIKQGNPITTIQQILGHENVQTTNRYTLTTERDISAALERLE